MIKMGSNYNRIFSPFIYKTNYIPTFNSFTGGPVDILRRVVRASRPHGRTFLYPRRGYGQIVDALAARTAERGVDIRTSTPATRIEQRDQIVVTTADGDLHADLVLSSVNPHAVAQLVSEVPPDVAAAIRSVRTRAMVLVYLILACDRYTAFDAHYVPDAKCATARLSEPKNYRDGDDPRGQTVLCAELPCWVGDETWTAGDVALGEVVTSDLRRLGLPRPEVIGVVSERLPSVYPVLERTTEAERARVAEWSDGLDRVVSFGRQGLAVPDNLHHVLAMGRQVAAAVNSDGSFDRGRWSTSRRSFEDHVVED